MIRNKTIAVVIPCYKVEHHIKKVIDEIPDYVDYIFAVNDCSPDATQAVLDKIEESNAKLVVLQHTYNQGVGGGMVTGFKACLEKNIDIVIKIDGDGQMDMAFMPKLIEAVIDGKYDFAKGDRVRNRRMLEKMPAIRRFGNLGLTFLVRIASGYWKISDPANGYLCITLSTLKKLDLSRLSKRFFFESSLIAELYYTGAKIKDVPMPSIYGDEKSNLSIWKVLFSFPTKLMKVYIRRLVTQYFIDDFNINSVYLLTGLPMFLFGVIFGIVKWIYYANLGTGAPTGTIVISLITIIMGFQLILSFIQNDMSNGNPFDNDE